MTAIVIKVISLLVTHDVLLVILDGINTETIVKLEVVSHVPLVLCISTYLVETYTSCRIFWVLTVLVTISDSYCFRSSTCKEIIKAVVTIVTSTVSHVSVISHLILEACTCSDLVVTIVVSEVILDGHSGIVHTIVPCKELITN